MYPAISTKIFYKPKSSNQKEFCCTYQLTN